jgi:hypothetical protein
VDPGCLENTWIQARNAPIDRQIVESWELVVWMDLRSHLSNGVQPAIVAGLS